MASQKQHPATPAIEQKDTEEEELSAQFVDVPIGRRDSELSEGTQKSFDHEKHIYATRDIDDHGDNDDNEDMDESSVKQTLNKRSFRSGLVTSLLLIWSLLMLPYEVNGAFIDRSAFVHDADLFAAAMWLWLVTSVCVILVSATSFLPYNRLLQSLEIYLLLGATCCQVAGAFLFSYSYCDNQSYAAESVLWTSCICNSLGMYLFYNTCFVAYFGFLKFATQNNGALPWLLNGVCDKRIFADVDAANDQARSLRFSKNFRVSYLSVLSAIAMTLVLVFGFDIYSQVDESHQAIYIGCTLMLAGTVCALLMQFLFHCRPCVRCWRRCLSQQEKTQRPRQVIDSSQQTLLSISDKHGIQVAEITTFKSEPKNGRSIQDSIETILSLMVYFLLYAAVVLIFLYSVVSQIPEADAVVDRLRLIANMVIVTGTAVLLSYEMYAKRDDYSVEESETEYSYSLIPDQAL